ncbi:MAG: hypothetical protein JSR27_08210 [Proteobacteria bacterium]|nr:hypothetical protein [Pseudomonadota bacterium]
MTLADKPEFLLISEIDDPRPVVGELFQRKFGHPIPQWKHDLVAFVRTREGTLAPMSYAKFMPFGSVILVGGCCTDGRAFAHLDPAQKDALAASGSAMVQLLRYGFARFADRCDGFFGYCGDARAWEVDLQAGFEPTGHDKLLVHWRKPINDQLKRGLVAMAQAIGPF